MRYRWPWPTNLVLVGVLLVWITAEASHGAEPPPTPGTAKPVAEAPPLNEDDARIQRDQVPLSSAAHEIREVIREYASENFAGIIIDVPAKIVVLYWVGLPPKEVMAKVDELRATTKIDIHADARFSLNELEKDRDAIFASQKTRKVQVKHRVHTASILSDGSGIEVTVEESDDKENERQKQNSKIKNVKVGPPPTPLTRQDDTPPYWGGANIRVGTRQCTSGFAVTSSTLAGGNFMLTAGHCFGSPAKGTLVFNGDGDQIGKVAGVIKDRDTMIIDLDGAGSGRAYDGAWNATSNISKPVVGRATNNTGEYVCFMGSLTGARCGIRINRDNVKYERPGLTIPYLIEGVSTDDRTISGEGDSGGSVVSLQGTNNSEFIARGTISFGDTGTTGTCLGYDGGRICTKTSLYMPISVHLNNWDATLMPPG